MSDAKTYEYDKGEAISILANAHARLEPDRYLKLRRGAARALLSAVGETATEAGYHVTPSPRDQDVFFIALHGDTSGFGVDAWSTADGISIQPVGERGEPRAILSAQITYDAAQKAWIGAPVPGEPGKRRSAVAMVADRIVEAFSK